MALSTNDFRIHYGDDAAYFGLTRELHKVRVIARFTVDGEPVPKPRHQYTSRGKGHAYNPKKASAAEALVALAFRQSAPGHEIRNDVTYGVSAVFFASTHQRRDVDNLIKLICDGLNGVAWADDVQVEEVSGRRGYDKNARTEVMIYELRHPMDSPSASQSRRGTIQHNTELTETPRAADAQALARARYIQSLRELAYLLEANPSLPLHGDPALSPAHERTVGGLRSGPSWRDR